MWRKYRGWILAGFALLSYLVGGIAVMVGLYMIGILGAQDLWGLGEAKGLGYLAFFVGIVLSVLGVLIMRILRNRQWT